MATIAELNVRIGAILAPMEKGLLQAEKKLQASGQRLSSIGQDIALSIGLPLAAIGVSAVKAAGDIESLTLALEGQLGSAEKAREELELLRKAALAPGLGFEQAVRGSVQLQAVGLSAEEARRTIEAFGNGLALAGKGGAELDGVITAIGQISSKGKVFAEEINQIAERLPQIRTLMKQAFGTSNTEDIQKLGLSSQEFTAAIVEQLEKLPKATGGIKNAFDNMRDSVNQSLATVGFAINDAFDVTGTLASFSNVISSLANSFAELNPTVRAVVLSVGAFLIALGPLVKIFGLLQAAKATYVIGLEGVKKGLLSVSGAALNAAKAFQALSLAQKATGIGIAIAVITALAFAYSELANSASDAEKAQMAVNDVNKTAAETVAKAKSETDLLIAAIKDENASYAERRKALDELIRIAPEYFGTLDKNKISIEAVTAAQEKYIASLLLTAKAQAARDKLVDLEKQLINVREAADPSILQQVGNGLLSLGNAGAFAALNAKTYAGNIEDLTKGIEAQRAALVDVILETDRSIASQTKAAGTTKKYGDTSVKTEAELRKEAAAIEAKNKALIEQSRLIQANFDPLADKPLLSSGLQGKTVNEVSTEFGVAVDPSFGAIRDGLFAMQDLVGATSETFTSLGLNVGAAFDAIKEKTLSFSEVYGIVAANVAENGSAIEQSAFAIANAVTAYSEQSEASLAGYVQALGQATKKIVKNFIQQGVSALVANVFRNPLTGASPLLAIPLAAAAGAAASALFSGLLGKIKIPALAEGGITTKPTLAMVGDNPGGREAIIPLNKLPGLMQQSGAGMGGIIAEYILRGQDLLTVLKRAETSNKRLTGAF